MAYNFSSPHITSLFFNPHTLSLALMHSDPSFSLYPFISLLSPPWLAIVLGGFMVVLWQFVGLILWLCSSRSWVWFCGFLLAMMGLNFVVVKFMGENVLDGVTVSLATGCGLWVIVLQWFWSVRGSDWFMVRGFFFFSMDHGWFGRGSWLIWLIWFMGFFWLWVVVCGVFFVWLWLVVADWDVVEEEGCWAVAAVVCGCGW